MWRRLPSPAARVAVIQALAEDFGRRTVASGFNRAEDMPCEDNYAAAAATVAGMINDGVIGLALLVNLIAALSSHQQAQSSEGDS